MENDNNAFEIINGTTYYKQKQKNKLIKEDLDKIFSLAKIGMSLEDIAKILKYDIELLENTQEVVDCVEQGQSILRMNLLCTQVNKAIVSKDTKMLVWLGKQFLNQKDNNDGEFKSEQFIIENDIPTLDITSKEEK